jgi:beta-glucosidase
MGAEAKRKGVNIILGPVVGPAGRVVQGGRNWEGFSVDPYLSRSLVYESIFALQAAGVTATTKVRTKVLAITCAMAFRSPD